MLNFSNLVLEKCTFGISCTCKMLMLSFLLFKKLLGCFVIIGFANVKSVQINLLTLLCGRTLKGSIFGGLRPKADLPLLIEKCKNKVNDNTCFKFIASLARDKYLDMRLVGWLSARNQAWWTFDSWSCFVTYKQSISTVGATRLYQGSYQDLAYLAINFIYCFQ